jgi:hypothetical protein
MYQIHLLKSVPTVCTAYSVHCTLHIP